MPIPDEWHLQRAFCIWYGGEQRKDGTWKVLPAKLPGVVFWHTPNGGSRDVVEGKRFKDIGALAGVHDLLFLWGGLYGMEWKKPNGKPAETQLSKEQRILHPQLLAAGMVASVVVDNLNDAKETVHRWGLCAP